MLGRFNDYLDGLLCDMRIGLRRAEAIAVLTLAFVPWAVGCFVMLRAVFLVAVSIVGLR